MSSLLFEPYRTLFPDLARPEAPSGERTLQAESQTDPFSSCSKMESNGKRMRGNSWLHLLLLLDSEFAPSPLGSEQHRESGWVIFEDIRYVRHDLGIIVSGSCKPVECHNVLVVM